MHDPSERYARQLLLPEIGAEGQRKLAQSSVLVVGCGGLGSPLATCLCVAGVGRLGLVDGDSVSLSNLNRQTLYAEDQIGRPKTDSARERLSRLNSSVAIDTYPTPLLPSNAADIISRYDIVADGTDNVQARLLISDTCSALSKPYVYASVLGLEGQVAVLCRGRASYRTLFPDFAEPLSPQAKEVVGVTPAVVGSVEASQALMLICGYGEPLVDRLWTLDLRTMQSFTIDL